MKYRIQATVLWKAVVVSICILNYLGITVEAADTAAILKEDVGEISLDGYKTHQLSIPTSSKTQIQLKSVTSSEKTVVIDTFPKSIAPGNPIQIKLLVMPEKEGKISSLIQVESTEGDTWLCEMEGNVVTKLHSKKHLKAESVTEQKQALLVTTDKLKELLAAKTPPQLVDIRQKTDFEKMHIPGSLNIPLSKVRYKSFLKKSPIVIIGGGILDDALAANLMKLKKNGFRCSFAATTVTAWHRQGNPVDGYLKKGSFSEITAFDLYRNMKELKWIALSYHDISTGKKRRENKLLAALDTRNIDYDSSKSNLAGLTEKELKNTDLAGKQLLIYSADGDDYRKIWDVIEKYKGAKAFFLKDGSTGFRQFAGRYISGRPVLKTTAQRCGCSRPLTEKKK